MLPTCWSGVFVLLGVCLGSPQQASRFPSMKATIRSEMPSANSTNSSSETETTTEEGLPPLPFNLTVDVTPFPDGLDFDPRSCPNGVDYTAKKCKTEPFFMKCPAGKVLSEAKDTCVDASAAVRQASEAILLALLQIMAPLALLP